ncbi:MAG TPA: metallophosphoesterase [Pirellulales bacterium]|jgi:DNA repair exonuclease SbcCD nuclease subunit|nr:metallophosphoesterase [Pirellulales bacterium]
MSRRRLRFIHSSDWHLERPLGGLVEVPQRLRPVFGEAPYLAAEKVVSAALAEQVDFVVLAGDVVDIELAGPHGAAFLVRQFKRLAQRHVPVYWAAGRVDRPEQWPVALRVPDNVFRFSSRRPQDFIVQPGDHPLARVTGMSRPRGGKIRAADFWPDPDGLPTIAVTPGRASRSALATRRLTYWALGGRHSRVDMLDAPHLAHYSGSPQARHPDETGAYGCTVVEIDEEGRVHTRPVATDVVRFCRRRTTVNPSTTADDLESRLAEQMRELHSAVPDLHLLVSWAVNGTGPLVAELRRGGLANEVLSRLRRRVEHDTPIVWSVSLEVEPEAAVPPAWLQHDSLLGDFLRSLAQFDGQSEQDPADLVGPLEELAGQGHEPEEIERLVRLSDSDRRRVLQHAALLGADLLSHDGSGTPSSVEARI